MPTSPGPLTTAVARLRRWGRMRTGTFALVVVLLLVALLAVYLLLGRQAPDCGGLLGRVQRASTPGRLDAALGGCPGVDVGGVRVMLAWDTALVLLYAALWTLVLSRLAAQPWRMRDARDLARSLAGAVLVVAALDLVVENGALLLLTFAGQPLSTGPVTVSLTAVGATVWWVKAAVLALATLVIGFLVVSSIGYSGRPPEETQPQFSPKTHSGCELGVALSGGGMRAATFSLGALRGLERRRYLDKARWLAAVSGGAYTAGAWYLARSEAGPGDVLTVPGDAEQDVAEETTSLYAYLRHYRHYLSSGRGGTAWPLIKFVVFLVVNILLLYVVVWIVARPVGWFLSSPGVAPELRNGVPAAESADLLGDLVHRGGPLVAVPAVLGLVAFAVSLFQWRTARQWQLAAVAALIAAAVFGAVFILAPWLTWRVPDLWHQLGELLPGQPAGAVSTSRGAGLLQLLTSLGLVGALTAAVRRPALKFAPRAGGILLALVVALFGGQLVINAARIGPTGDPARARITDPIADLAGRTSLNEVEAWLVLSALMLAVSVVVNQRWWSLHTIYKRGLRNTFSATRDEASKADGLAPTYGYYPFSNDAEPTWERCPVRSTAEDGPQLLVCAAVHRRSKDVTGVSAASFVFSSTDIGWYEPGPHGRFLGVPATRYVDSLPGLGRYRRSQGTVASAVATTGAAVASALGRHSLGTTQSLLAVFNLRLGVWLPNPARIDPRDEVGTKRFAAPKLLYLLKEVFGRYSPGDDPFVYVADGGHWENLGIIELLRRRCRYVVCVDASGDEPYSFTALENARQLASAELDVAVDIDLTGLRPATGYRLPATNVAVGTIGYGQGVEPGVLVYGKLQVARDSTKAVRDFTSLDSRFPRYPTFNLFLRRRQLEHMTLIGEEIADKLADELARGGVAPAPGRNAETRTRDPDTA